MFQNLALVYSSTADKNSFFSWACILSSYCPCSYSTMCGVDMTVMPLLILFMYQKIITDNGYMLFSCPACW